METSNDSLVAISSEKPMNITEDVKKTPILFKKRILRVKLPKRQALKTKKAVEFLLAGSLKSKVCRYCLFVDYSLHGMDEIMNIAGEHAIYKVKIRDIVASFYPFKISSDPDLPNKICNKCLDVALRSYLFVQQCERSERSLRNCFEDMFDKLNKLDPLDKTKKRGRQKLNPNHNIINTEHVYVTDYAEPIQHLVNSGAVPYTNEPIMSELECKKCWQVLPSLEALVNHEKIHPKSMWYNCRMCGKSYSKIMHFHKHIKRDHTKKDTVVNNDNNFNCKECNFSCEDLNMYLQHTEKHKFKVVLEHILERSTDELCTICLDKGNKMVDMNTNISLNGGYPELRGYRSMYNIVGSTIPEKNQYKYQELMIPCKANVMSIIKKRKVASFGEKLSSENIKCFILSNPIVISKRNIDIKDIFTYIFTKPYNLNDEDTIIESDDDMNDQTKTNVTIDENQFNDKNYDLNEVFNNYVMTVEDFKEKNIIFDKENVVFVFSNPEYVDKVLTYKNNGIEHLHNEKVVLEIEKDTLTRENEGLNDSQKEEMASSDYKPSAIDALYKNDDVKYKKTEKECKICYIFTKIGKCEYCKKELNNTDDKISKKDAFNRNVQLKRKSKDAIHDLPKKTKWTCAICLTNNEIDRKTCVCCDLEDFSETGKEIKVAFGTNKKYFLDDKDIADTVTTGVKDNMDEENNRNGGKYSNNHNKGETSIKKDTFEATEDITMNTTVLKLNLKNITEENIFITTPNNSEDNPNNDSQEGMQNAESILVECCEDMDVEETPIIEQNLTANNYQSPIFKEETLIAENYFQSSILNEGNILHNNAFQSVHNFDPTLPNSSQFTNSMSNVELTKFQSFKSLQFTIGSFGSKGADLRRIKRPVKRPRAYK